MRKNSVVGLCGSLTRGRWRKTEWSNKKRFGKVEGQQWQKWLEVIP